MNTQPFLFIAGPCVVETEAMTLHIARELRRITAPLPVRFVFKASYDKANRTSVDAYRGPGLEAGLNILRRVKEQADVAILTDVHDVQQVGPAAEVADILQIPAFLCRQTDLVVAAARTGKTLNIKKGQFLAPDDMGYVVQKAEAAGNTDLVLTERGTTFGYHNLVVDFRSFAVLRSFGYPVVFDATHAVQIPSLGGVSSGRSEYAIPLARAAAAYGIDGLFCEVHPEPARALCDAANSLPLEAVGGLLRSVLAVRDAAG